MKSKLIAVLSVLVLQCSAYQQQKAQPAATDDLHFKNLEVLPQNISREQLLKTMRRFTQALGVGCDYCHAAAPALAAEAKPELEFSSDAKPAKHAARLMILMTNDINDKTISRIPDAHTTVTCWTCHRGESQPAIAPSLPQKQAFRR